MLRKIGFALSLSAAIVGAGATSAYALDCSNVSRPAPAQPAQPVAAVPHFGTIWVISGDWWFISFADNSGNFTPFSAGIWDKIPPGTASSVLHITAAEAANLGLPAGTINGNYQGGQGFGLLDNAQAPCIANRQTTNGIQALSFRCPPAP